MYVFLGWTAFALGVCSCSPQREVRVLLFNWAPGLRLGSGLTLCPSGLDWAHSVSFWAGLDTLLCPPGLDWAPFVSSWAGLGTL